MLRAVSRRRPTAAALVILIAAVSAGPAEAAERTGRWIVLFEEDARPSAAIVRAGAHRAGPSLPELKAAPVNGPAAAIRALRRQRGVERVIPEYRRDYRLTPNDPGWGANETAPRTPAGTPLQWALRREGFPEAWDVTTGGDALVGVIDTGVDGAHPELAGKIAFGQAVGGSGTPLTDEDGHGTHVSGIACAATDNALGLAGAGFGCRIVVIKAPELRDADIAEGIVAAADRGVHAINMSFGGGPPSDMIERAIAYAYAKDVVLVAAASNEADEDQGAPASQLQPGDASDVARGRGLVVTAVDFQDRRAGTGFGNQISIAAYGFFGADGGPPGLISTYPEAFTEREGVNVSDGVIAGPCDCRTSLGGDDRYAYLQGTSMAVPQVTATAALVADLNPALTVADTIRILKQSARGPGGWTPDLGWGILDARAAIDAARRVDRTAPSSLARARATAGFLRIRVSGRDQPGNAGLLPSGVERYEVYVRRDRGRYRRVRRTTSGGTLRVRIRRPGVYSVYTRAVDAAGNREAVPRRPDAKLRVRR
jgi:subtilisin family serine protease